MRVYATTDDGRRFLHEIKCDNCDAAIRPNPEIAKSGWTKHGRRVGDSDWETWEYCHDCSTAALRR